MSFVTRPILCGGVGCGFEMRSQLPLALDSSARTNTAKAGCLAQWLGDTVGPTEATTDSTSKVVDDSHAEDCKTWLFISEGTSGSDVPPLFFGKGGAVNITKTKEYALAQAHAAALLYHERLEGHSIKIHCEDDLTLAIVWDARNSLIYVAWITIWMIPSDVVFLLESSMRICLGDAESHLSE